MQGASPLASPGLGGMRYWVCLWKAGYGGGLARAALGHGGRSCVRRGGACLLGCLPTLPGTFSFFIPISRQEDRAQTMGFSQYSVFGKSSGGSGGLFQESPSVPISRQEDRAQTIGFSQYSIFGKVLGGLGDSFKSPPAFFPSFPPFPRQMLSDGRGCGSVPAGA